jgi:hypothetical protein
VTAVFVFLIIGVYPLIYTTGAAFYCKNDLVSSKKCYVYGGFYFYSVVPPASGKAAMKFCITIIALAAGLPSLTVFQQELLSK